MLITEKLRLVSDIDCRDRRETLRHTFSVIAVRLLFESSRISPLVILSGHYSISALAPHQAEITR